MCLDIWVKLILVKYYLRGADSGRVFRCFEADF